VLKPGGRLVILDSLQRGDRPDYDGLLELFPQNYHEPYYSSYANEDFGALAADCDLKPVRNVESFFSKVMVFDKPGVRATNDAMRRRPPCRSGAMAASRKRPGRGDASTAAE
jgi:hypothetical protein